MNVATMNAPVALNRRDTTAEPSCPEKTVSGKDVDDHQKSSKDRSRPIEKTRATSGSSSSPHKSTSKKVSPSAKSKSSETTKTHSTTKTRDSASSRRSTTTAQTEGEQSEASATIAPNSSTKPTEPSSIDDVEDEEVRLAMEMALAAAQNPKLSAAEIRELVGERNKQLKIVSEFSQKKREAEERKKQEEIEEAQKRWDEKREMAITWWQAKSMAVKETAAQLTEAAVKRVEEMKLNAEFSLYAEQIKKDPETNELRKKIKLARKVYKANRLNGNRIETRHAFKRQRMEKRLLQVCDKLNKTQKLFTHSSYNVQEYLKALMRASKKWRKKGTDEELMLEAQLCRNMHQMLALEKQKVKCKKNQREMKKYLQRCKGWLTDKKAFCEMNQMTLEATIHSMKVLYEDIIAKQDDLIQRLKESDEFKNVDLSDVDLSHIRLPVLPSARDAERTARLMAMKGLPLNDSIRMKKEASVKSGNMNNSRGTLDAGSLHRRGPELYVTARDDVSVCSGLSDPDEPMNNIDNADFHITMIGGHESKLSGSNRSIEDSDSNFNFGNDAPWMTSCNASYRSSGTDMKSIESCSVMKALITPDIIEEDEEENVAVVVGEETKQSISSQQSLKKLSQISIKSDRSPKVDDGHAMSSVSISHSPLHIKPAEDTHVNDVELSVDHGATGSAGHVKDKILNISSEETAPDNDIKEQKNTSQSQTRVETQPSKGNDDSLLN